VPCLSHNNNTWRRWQQITKLLVIQFTAVSCHFIPVRSKHTLQHPILKRPQSVFVPYLLVQTTNIHVLVVFVCFSLTLPLFKPLTSSSTVAMQTCEVGRTVALFNSLRSWKFMPWEVSETNYGNMLQKRKMEYGDGATWLIEVRVVMKHMRYKTQHAMLVLLVA
jgi:hypothetical protein